jgi:hypothetical protein
MNRFEQLIEYVINDEEQKARELFHDIVVEKSRKIYEDIMAADEVDESDESDDDQIDEELGGDAAGELIDDVETEEQDNMNMEDEEVMGDEESDMGDEESDMGDEFTMGGDEGGTEPATKDDIMNLEDKLDQLMAEFEDLMGGGDDMGGNGDDFGPEDGGDAIEMDDTGEMDNMGMMEAVTLKAAPKPVTSEEGGVNKKSTVAANAGAKGPVGNSVKPVRTGAAEGGKHDAAGAYSNQTKDLIGKVGNSPAQATQNLKPANKPHLSQATGVNTKSPLARG